MCNKCVTGSALRFRISNRSQIDQPIVSKFPLVWGILPKSATLYLSPARGSLESERSTDRYVSEDRSGDRYWRYSRIVCEEKICNGTLKVRLINFLKLLLDLVLIVVIILIMIYRPIYDHGDQSH